MNRRVGAGRRGVQLLITRRFAAVAMSLWLNEQPASCGALALFEEIARKSHRKKRWENRLTNAFVGRKFKHGDRVGIQASLVVRPPGCFEIRGHPRFGCFGGHSRKSAGSLLAIDALRFAVSLRHPV